MKRCQEPSPRVVLPRSLLNHWQDDNTEGRERGREKKRDDGAKVVMSARFIFTPVAAVGMTHSDMDVRVYFGR